MIIFSLLHLLLLWALEFYPYPELFIYPYLTAHGFLPYQQILDQHFPGLMFFPINFYSLGFDNPLAFKLLLLTVVLIQSRLIYKISKSNLAVLTYTLWQPFLEGNQLWLDTFLGLFTLPAFYLAQAKKWFWVGLILGCGVVFKQTLIPLVAFVGLYILWQRDFKALTRFGLAVIFPSLLMLTYLQHLGVWNDFWFWAVKFNLEAYAAGGKLAPTLGQLAKLALPVILLTYVFIKNKQSRLIIGWLMFSVIGGLTRFGFIHLQPAIPFFAIIVGTFVLSKKIVTIFLVLSLALIGQFYFRQTNFLRIHFFDAETQKIASFIKDNTQPGDKIFLLGVNPHLYALTETLPSGQIFVFQFPWFLKIAQPRILQALVNDPPKVILFDPDSNIDNQLLINYASDLVGYSRSHYQEVGRIGKILEYKRGF